MANGNSRPDKVTVAMLTTVFVFIASVITGWVFIDERYAHADTVKKSFDAQQKTQKELTLALRNAIFNFEKNQNNLQAVMIENYIESERDKETPNNTKLEKWERQLRNIDVRNEALDNEILSTTSP